MMLYSAFLPTFSLLSNSLQSAANVVKKFSRTSWGCRQASWF